jgi:hypothetical protein
MGDQAPFEYEDEDDELKSPDISDINNWNLENLLVLNRTNISDLKRQQWLFIHF